MSETLAGLPNAQLLERVFVWCQRIRGDLHLTAVGLLAPKLTATNCAELIRAARHRSADVIRELLADREPRPTPASFVCRVPEPAKQKLTTAPPVTLSQPGKILARAINCLLERTRKRKFAETSAPRPQRAPTSSNQTPSRDIPAAIRRGVWQRDSGRCTYVSSSGRRCGSRDFVEFDHVEAWARTRAHPIEGITLRCHAHNQLRARQDFGEMHMARFERRTGFESSSP